MNGPQRKNTDDPIVLRIQTLLVRQKKTSKDLEKALGLSNGAVSKWKYAGTKSYMKYMPLIAEYLNVTIDELVGDDFPYVTAEQGMKDVEGKISEDERQLLGMYRSLDENGRKCMHLTLKYVVDLMGIKAKIESEE
jgi:transcriptional regulator with XRE-family HTH domain